MFYMQLMRGNSFWRCANGHNIHHRSRDGGEVDAVGRLLVSRKPIDEESLLGAIRLSMKSITSNKIDEVDKNVKTLNELKKGKRFTRLFTVTEPAD